MGTGKLPNWCRVSEFTREREKSIHDGYNRWDQYYRTLPHTKRRPRRSEKLKPAKLQKLARCVEGMTDDQIAAIFHQYVERIPRYGTSR